MLSKLFLIVAVVFFAMWLVATYGSQIPLLGKLGRLPGDIHIHRDNFSFYIPVVSSIVVSIILTVMLRLFTRI